MFVFFTTTYQTKNLWDSQSSFQQQQQRHQHAKASYNTTTNFFFFNNMYILCKMFVFSTTTTTNWSLKVVFSTATTFSLTFRSSLYHKKEQRLTREAMKNYLRDRGDMVSKLSCFAARNKLCFAWKTPRLSRCSEYHKIRLFFTIMSLLGSLWWSSLR